MEGCNRHGVDCQIKSGNDDMKGTSFEMTELGVVARKQSKALATCQPGRSMANTLSTAA